MLSGIGGDETWTTVWPAARPAAVRVGGSAAGGGDGAGAAPEDAGSGGPQYPGPGPAGGAFGDHEGTPGVPGITPSGGSVGCVGSRQNSRSGSGLRSCSFSRYS